MTELANLTGKSLLNLESLTEREFSCLLDLAAQLKKKKKAGRPGSLLRQKTIALVFEKPSTRTRCAAIVAAVDEGATAEYLDIHAIHLGKKESVADTARVLGGMVDGILFRGYKQETVEELARCAGVPVWNGLTDESHPTQILADCLTIRENFGKLRGLKLVYIGDGRNNVVNSLMAGCAKMGINFVNCTPAELNPDRIRVERAQAMAIPMKSSVAISHDPLEAVRGANVVYTDVWVSMGEEAQFKERLRLLKPYQVTMDLMRATGNVEGGKVIFLHCLPAFHDKSTEFTREIGALEVTDEVFKAPFSKVFDQSENKVHTLKALMVATLAGVGKRRAAGSRGAARNGK